MYKIPENEYYTKQKKIIKEAYKNKLQSKNVQTATEQIRNYYYLTNC